ncbi:MAG: YbbP [Planctomycetota bacterium]
MNPFAGETWADAVFWLRSGVEIAILWFVLYRVLLALERISAGGKMRGIAIGLGLVGAAWLLARYLELHAISWLLQASLGFLAVVLIVVLQPELRRLFARLGGILPSLEIGGGPGDGNVAAHLIDALGFMSSRRIGALVVVERGDRLDDLVATSPFDCDLTSKALVTVFWKDSPLHDGAVVVRRGRIAAAGVILPLTTNAAYRHLSGTRHRAGVGISEDTDALALIVSEETGAISVADRGELSTGLSQHDLQVLLGRVFRGAPTRHSGLLRVIRRKGAG